MIEDELNIGGSEAETGTGAPSSSAPRETAESSAPAGDGAKPAIGAEDTGGAKAAEPSQADKDVVDLLGPNWRDRIVTAPGFKDEERTKIKAYLDRRGSIYDVLRSGANSDQKISELMRDRVKIPTGKNDDPKEIAAYRKARGAPEDPEKYDIKLPEDFGELDSLDKDLSSDFKKRAHALHWGQKDFDLAIETVVARDRMRAAEQANKVLRAKEAAVDELRIHFGKDYRPTVEMINRMIGEEMAAIGIDDPNLRREALSERFADGMALGEKPWFVKMMANIARKYGDPGVFEAGEPVEGGDVDSKIETIMGMMMTNPKEYERMQPELKRLIEIQERRNKRRA